MIAKINSGVDKTMNLIAKDSWTFIILSIFVLGLHTALFFVGWFCLFVALVLNDLLMIGISILIIIANFLGVLYYDKKYNQKKEVKLYYG